MKEKPANEAVACVEEALMALGRVRDRVDKLCWAPDTATRRDIKDVREACIEAHTETDRAVYLLGEELIRLKEVAL